jgi:UDP-N-acetylglucosamine 2-epimerase (non-hydrolysing)
MNNRILIVVGTRPNFIKITRFKKVNEMMGHPFDIRIVHTGQHYDDKMAAVFFSNSNWSLIFF